MLDQLRELAVHDVSDDAARCLHAQMLSHHQAAQTRGKIARASLACGLATTCVTYLTWAVAFTIALR